jgi:hypothetical protein
MQYMQAGRNVRTAQLIDLRHDQVRSPISRPIWKITRPSNCWISEYGQSVGDSALLVSFGW